MSYRFAIATLTQLDCVFLWEPILGTQARSSRESPNAPMKNPRGGRRFTSESYYDASKHDYKNKVIDRGFAQKETRSVAKCTVATTRHKQRRFTQNPLDDRYAQWQPFRGKTFGADTSTAQGSQDPLDEGDQDDEDTSLFIEETGPQANAGDKRKRYTNSDDPNSTWRLEAVTYLRELFRFDGLGDALAHPCCHQCGVAYKSDDGDKITRLFRCQDCHVLLQCLDCCLEQHKYSPLHVVQEYNGTYFEKTCLSRLGLVYQLGHGGLCCDYPDPLVRTMTVLSRNGIHRVSFQYCNCVLHQQPSHAQQCLRNGWYPSTPIEPRTCATFACLDLFRLANVVANVNARDFVTVLEKLTDPLGLEKLPDRYNAFGRMSRQWSFLHRLKRSGVGFSIQVLSEIPPGGLAVKCWGCPWLGINIPPKWNQQTAVGKYRYLYMPILAVDANFRLKNKLRANQHADPSLSPGSAYFVDSAPYKKFLSKYVSETDVSTCVAFAALAEKDTKLATGLRTSGVGGCACARHEIIRPLGLGDLQKGERNANMDYIFYSAIRGLLLPRIGVSYDIICQWKTYVQSRVSRLPPELQPAQPIEFTFGLPTWHAVVHERSCKSANSLTYQEGVGRTDGEGIERIWSQLNPAGFATKEMGEGNRHDTLDDRVDYLNFNKNISHGSTLSRKLQAALDEQWKQIASFEFADKALDPEKRASWLLIVDAWKKDHTQPCPYLLPDMTEGPSEEAVQKQLKALEEKEKEEGRTPIYGTSPSSFMAIGLQLEELQQSIRQDASMKGRSAAKEMRIRERRETFSEMLENFRQLQDIYMPGAIRAINDEDSNATSLPVAENVKIWLPSDLSPRERVTGCASNILTIEGQLRAARCSDALLSLRQHLHTKQWLIAFRNANVTGQNDSTRARSLIDRVGERVDTAAEKYRRSRQALLNLDDPEISRFPELAPNDIALDDAIDPDLVAMLRLGRIGNESNRKTHVSTGKKTLSWIWTADGGPKDGSDEDECVRVEWSKALARKDRWTEEVERLTEEMKCVLRYLDWEEGFWMERMPALEEVRLSHPAAAIEAGMRAYAARQADIRRKLSQSFRKQWGNPSTS